LVIKLKIIFFLLLFPTISVAQSDDIQFEHLTVEDGLSSNCVNAILQDNRGFMWFGTTNGLNRWDGYEFKIFSHNPNDSSSLSSNEISAMYEDSKGVMWIGTYNGLNKFNKKTEKFTQYKTSVDSIDNTLGNFIYQIIEDNSGVIWFCTGYGLCKMDATTGEIKRFIPKHEIHKTFFNPNYIHSVCEVEANRLLLGTAGGLISFDTEVEEFTKLPFNDPYIDDRPTVHRVYKDKVGLLWIGMASQGLIQYDLESRKFHHFKYDPRDPFSLSYNSVWSIFEDQSGVLWIGTSGGGLNRFDKDTNRFTAYKHNSRDEESICSSTIMAIYGDKESNLWIGTRNNGISRVTKWKKPFKNYEYDTDDPSSFGHSEAISICEDRSGDLWVAQWGSGVSRLMRESGKFIHYVYKPSAKINISNDWVSDIYEDRADYIWVGSMGLDRIDINANQVIHYEQDPDDPNSLGGARVNLIYEDRDGILWLGIYLLGLDRFNKELETFKHYRQDLLDSLSLSNNYVLSLYQDSEDILWVGTADGLCKLVKFENGKEGFVCYKNDPLNPTSISHNIIYRVFEDSNKRLWIGTEYGLNLFNREKENFISYTTDDGLPGNIIYSILEDDHHNLWLRTNRGLVKFNPETKIFKTYDERDGLKYCRTIEFGYNAFHKGRSGKFYYGGMNSIAVFHPDSLQDNPNAPRIVLTDFKIDNKPVEIGDNSCLKKLITETKIIELPYYEKILSFEFAALDYTAPSKNQYAYKMEGVDRDWVYTDATRRYVSYTNLDPGEYIFRVKGSNNDGVWNEEGVSIAIIINPPWWATWWAYVLYGIFIVSLFTGITRFYLNRQRLKHQLELEHEHAEKLGEIDQLKSRFFANISHEFRTPLTLIIGPVKQVITKIKDEKVKEELSMVHRSAKKLHGMVNQLLDLSKLEAGGMELKTSEENIIPLLKGLVLSFASLAERKKITLKFSSVLDEILVFVDRDKIEKIINNILSNAFKFTPEGGCINVNVKITNGKVEISFSDSGIGISEERIDKIFDRFFQVDGSHTREQEGTGIGLALTKELVELHKGEIEVESEEGKGTSFTVRLLLGKDHLKPEEIIEEKVKEEKKAVIPIEKAELIPESRTKEEKIDVETITETGKPTLLIVEDNVDVRNYIRGYLEKSFRISEAVDGKDGLDKSLKYMPDLIVSDVMMPKMDGFELCKKLKTDERTSHIPVILLTAKASGQDKIEGLEIGADDYLMKPFDAEELKARIKNLIEQRRKLRERFHREIGIKPKDIATTSMDQQFLQKVINIVEKHISDPDLSIEDFSKEVGMSRIHLNRKLKALTDKTTSDFISTLRLKRAAILLQQKSTTVSEVAFDVGFNNLSYFARKFREQFGILPSEYTIQNSAND